MALDSATNSVTVKPRRSPRSRFMRVIRGDRFTSIAYPLITIGVLVGIWELWVRLRDVPPYLMPKFSSVVGSMFTEFVPLLPDTWQTLQEIALGFGLSVIVGIPLAILIVSSRPFEKSVYPVLVTSQVVPKVAIAPLIVVWLGFGMTGKVLIVFTIAFFPIVIDTVVGLRSVELEKFYLGRSMGMSRIQLFRMIRLPQALPMIFSGLKLAATFAVIGAVVGEFVAADRGLGRVIMAASSSFDTTLLFTGVAYLTIIGLIAFFSVEVVERLVLPWHVSRRVERMGGS
jgi:NitT/TauT family transport system permease protein